MFNAPRPITDRRDGDGVGTEGNAGSGPSFRGGICTGSVTGGTVFNAPRPITDRRDGDSDGGDNVATEEGSSSTDGDDDGEAFGSVGNGSKILDD